MKYYIYLDDVRTPNGVNWIVVRNYDEFIQKINEIGLENIELISLDHDLGDSAMAEWMDNVYVNNELNYNNITEKTGYDAAKWLVNQWMDGKPVCKVMVHSANVVGSYNIIGYINNYKQMNRLEQDCRRWIIPFTC